MNTVCGYYTVQMDTVSSVAYEQVGDFYDMTVPGAAHYFAEGYWHHNTGKTFAGLYRLDSEARRYPDQYILARKVRATMDSTVLGTWRRIIALRGGVTAFGGEHPQFYVYPNGARVWVVGFDNPDKILSGEFGGAYVNQAEELDEADFETLTTRVTGRGSQTPTPMVWGDCNPGPEDHWIMRRAQSGALMLLESRHEDNPTLHDGSDWTEQGRRTLATLDALTGVRYQRLRLGRWVGAEGQYFDQWDEARHVIAPRATTGRHVWGAFDYGFTHNTAFLLLSSGPDGSIEVIGEHVQHKWLPSQHAAAMDALCARLGVRPRFVVAGLDVFQAKGDSDGRTIADQYAALGWRFEPAQVDRVSGAAELSQRLGNPAADIAPTLRVWQTCPRLIATMPRMVHDPRRPEDVLKTDADAEGRGGDDPYDALRYGVMATRQPVTIRRARTTDRFGDVR